jgi:hypothetical protein
MELFANAQSGREARRHPALSLRYGQRSWRLVHQLILCRSRRLPQGDLLGTAGALMFTSTFLVPPPLLPPINWPPKKKSAAATIITKISFAGNRPVP